MYVRNSVLIPIIFNLPISTNQIYIERFKNQLGVNIIENYLVDLVEIWFIREHDLQYRICSADRNRARSRVSIFRHVYANIPAADNEAERENVVGSDVCIVMLVCAR